MRRQVDCDGGTTVWTRARCGHGADLVDHLQHYASAPEDSDVRDIAQRLLGIAAVPVRWSLPLTDILLFLKRIPLYSSMHLEQLRTVAAHLVERDVLSGEVIFVRASSAMNSTLLSRGRWRSCNNAPTGRSRW